MSLERLKTHVEALQKDEKNPHGYRAHASFEMLIASDLMIEAFWAHHTEDKGQLLLDVFGLLQSLFVAIDALYDLSIGLTKFKYHININANPRLHELKFIRNDLVGHPTHRSYAHGGIGFSVLDVESLNQTSLDYNTYIYHKNELEIKTTTVDFKPLVDAYYLERKSLLEGLLNFVTKAEKQTDIPERIYKLFESLNLELLDEIMKAFITYYQLKPTDHHRFIWRAELLRKLIIWEMPEPSLNEMILYMAKTQTIKMYDIAMNLEGRKNNDLYARLPKILSSFYRFIRHNEAELIPLLEHLHDVKHPLHKSDLEALRQEKSSKDVLMLLDWLDQQTDSDLVYLIGSQLKAYRKRS